MTLAIEYRQHLRRGMMPHILCPGCGHGIVLKALFRAIERLELDWDRLAFVAGIGCSSRLVGYIDGSTVHTTHGRALTFATGLKLARPDLTVVVITGDGDGLAIGGNHLIHAARRDMDLTCLLLNNEIYGMTGGQAAPTTAPGGMSTTTTRGAREPSFDACRLVTAAGASFVARGATSLPIQLDELIARGIAHRGFSFLEIASDCPEYFGRYNHLGRGPEMIQMQRRRLDEVDETLRQKRFVDGAHATEGKARLHTGVLHEVAR